ncbi:MAG: transposase [Bythopirellula sp.]
MPAKPRSETFNPDVVGVYHCWNRIVQRRHLFGFDSLTGKDYGYRKQWVWDRLNELAAMMGIDVLDYAILDNHLHLVLRNRPDVIQQWDDLEVAKRWWLLCPERKEDDGSAAEPTNCELRHLQQDADEYRKRLSNISWFMRLLCQPIARRANREDDVDGRFFAKRFDCKRLESEADVLACSLYVDLNVIHAGKAESPEESEYTSACDRIRSRWCSAQEEFAGMPSTTSTDHADSWLAPVFLDERAESYENIEQAACSNPIGTARVSNKGFLPITCRQYLALLDVLGRTIRCDKRGHIPTDLPPLLERLDMSVENLVSSVHNLFHGSSCYRAGPTLAPG